jgi:2-polyprenyl-6-methoxyphenol hydroxylase-like FAD-dependent oxidoreductase
MEPVAIVGGGPVGLALSLVLARYKVPTLVLEAREPPPASLGPSPGCPKGWSCSTGWA